LNRRPSSFHIICVCAARDHTTMLVDPSSFDCRSRNNLVSYLVGFILNCDVRRSEYSSKGRKCCQRIASAAARSAIKFRRPIQFGCMNGQMTGCYEGVDTYSTAHYVIIDLVD
jgi:hypothetical protein